MIDPRWLMRMSMWARNPPSTKRVLLVFGAIALALIIVGVEWMDWWPDWAKVERIPRGF